MRPDPSYNDDGSLSSCSILLRTASQTSHPLRVLVEEVEHGLVTALVLLLDLGVLQVRPGRHEAVDLRRESLDVVGHLQVGLESFHIFGRLIPGGDHQERHIDVLGVIGVNHGRVSLSSSLEELVVGADRQSGDLSAPTEA